MKKTGTSIFGTPWFAQRFMTGKTVTLETMNALQRLWPMHMTTDQTREMAAALSELADHVDGVEHVSREQLQQQLEETTGAFNALQQEVEHVRSVHWNSLTIEQQDAALNGVCT